MTDAPHFKDPRSRTLWRTGRVVLKGQDKTDLRRQVYRRAGGRCEIEWNGKRCNRYAPWAGIKHGELVHVVASAHAGSDTVANIALGMSRLSPPASSTPDRSLLLSGDEGQRLARIARDRANRFMVSGPDVDFLLDVLVRLSR